MCLLCERVVRALEPRIGRRGTPAIAVLDIEQLSTINDSFGRNAGDLLLQQVADRMKRHFDSTDLLAHFGAGTFGVIMEAAGDEDEAFHWMREQIMDVFRAPFTVDARGIPVDVKCGFARYPDNGNDANALVQNAVVKLSYGVGLLETYLVGAHAHVSPLLAKWIATAAIGYADGLHRSLSNRGLAFFDGKPVPLVGRVSMDLTTFDVTEAPDVVPGTWLEIMGPSQTPDQLAEAAGTNGYEMLTSLGGRFHRTYIAA